MSGKEKSKSGIEFQPQLNILPRRMSMVPGFRPPEVAQENRVRQPQVCSREDENEYRSAGVLLQALAVEARVWSQQLPGNFRPAIVAILHAGASGHGATGMLCRTARH